MRIDGTQDKNCLGVFEKKPNPKQQKNTKKIEKKDNCRSTNQNHIEEKDNCRSSNNHDIEEKDNSNQTNNDEDDFCEEDEYEIKDSTPTETKYIEGVYLMFLGTSGNPLTKAKFYNDEKQINMKTL